MHVMNEQGNYWKHGFRTFKVISLVGQRPWIFIKPFITAFRTKIDLNVLGELDNICFLTHVHNHVAIYQTIRTIENLYNQMHYLLLAFLWCSIWRGKGSTLGKCQLCCCKIWSLQGRLIIALFIILAIFSMNIQILK